MAQIHAAFNDIVIQGVPALVGIVLIWFKQSSHGLLNA